MKPRRILPYGAIALIVIGTAAFAAGVHSLLSAAAGHEDNLRELSDVASAWSRIVGFTAAIGLITMAAVETVKRLLPVRGYFYRAQLIDLIGFDWNDKSQTTTHVVAKSLAWFDVPLEQLIGQIGALAQTELDRWLFPPATNAVGDNVLLAAIVQERFPKLPPVPQSVSDRENLEADLRAELEVQLDRLQIIWGGRWRRTIRYTSCVAAGGIASGVLAGSGVAPFIAVEVGITTFFVGGFFSWLARDIVAGVERWRG
jgi:hypothetical protein